MEDHPDLKRFFADIEYYIWYYITICQKHESDENLPF